jgi:hypothetical protein
MRLPLREGGAAVQSQTGDWRDLAITETAPGSHHRDIAASLNNLAVSISLGIEHDSTKQDTHL